MGKNNARIVDINLLLQAGINPKTGLPIKFGNNKCTTKEDIKKCIRKNDEQVAVNKYTWSNLPCNITSQELERMLYYKGQLCFFYMKELDQFFFMPYALDGTIDFYGRFNTIHPVPMTSGTEDKGNKAQAELLSNIKLDCVYGVILPEELKLEDLFKKTVLLHDYTKQLSQNIVPTQMVNEPIIDLEAECMPYMRTALLMGTGVRGVRVDDTDQEASVAEGSKNMYKAALEGDPYVPITGKLEFQELTNGAPQKSEEYLLAMQSIDNFRLSLHGVDNGGLFEKKAHMLEAEAAINGGPVDLVLQDGLSIRQNFCNIVNSIWGIGIWCEINETLSKADINGDGLLYDRNEDGQNGGVDNNESEVNDNE